MPPTSHASPSRDTLGRAPMPPPAPSLEARLADAYRAHHRHVWGVCYRMTGSAADADELVQDTFARALERPPLDLEASARPWLVKVAANLARDRLRRRRHAAYTGPWLPSPVETPEGSTVAEDLPEARYGAVESVTFAFLLALEALTPQQRAVLLLRDVLDYSVRETARALGLSETNTKVTHLRARRAMAAYDADRCIPDPARIARTRDALAAFVSGLMMDDVASLERLLAEDVVTVNDGGGVYQAARKPVRGRDKTILFHRKVRRAPDTPLVAEVRLVNGLPAVVATYGATGPGLAPRVVLRVEVDAVGRVRVVQSVLAPEKLTAIAFPGS